MPQTLESIKLAQKDNVPLIVALNKMDKGVQKRIDGVKRELMNAGVELEGMPINLTVRNGWECSNYTNLCQN